MVPKVVQGPLRISSGCTRITYLPSISQQGKTSHKGVKGSWGTSMPGRSDRSSHVCVKPTVIVKVLFAANLHLKPSQIGLSRLSLGRQ
jgi:hypothetical protein